MITIVVELMILLDKKKGMPVWRMKLYWLILYRFQDYQSWACSFGKMLGFELGENKKNFLVIQILIGEDIPVDIFLTPLN